MSFSCVQNTYCAKWNSVVNFVYQITVRIFLAQLRYYEMDLILTKLNYEQYVHIYYRIVYGL